MEHALLIVGKHIAGSTLSSNINYFQESHHQLLYKDGCKSSRVITPLDYEYYQYLCRKINVYLWNSVNANLYHCNNSSYFLQFQLGTCFTLHEILHICYLQCYLYVTSRVEVLWLTCTFHGLRLAMTAFAKAVVVAKPPMSFVLTYVYAYRVLES